MQTVNIIDVRTTFNYEFVMESTVKNRVRLKMKEHLCSEAVSPVNKQSKAHVFFDTQ